MAQRSDPMASSSSITKAESTWLTSLMQLKCANYHTGDRINSCSFELHLLIVFSYTGCHLGHVLWCLGPWVRQRCWAGPFPRCCSHWRGLVVICLGLMLPALHSVPVRPRGGRPPHPPGSAAESNTLTHSAHNLSTKAIAPQIFFDALSRPTLFYYTTSLPDIHMVDDVRYEPSLGVAALTPFAEPCCVFHSFFHVCWHLGSVLDLFLLPVSIPTVTAKSKMSQPHYVGLIGCV